MSKHRTKTERDLVFDENKKFIRAKVRLEVDRLYVRRTNYLIDEMQKDFEIREKRGELLRLLPEPTPGFLELVEDGKDELLAIESGK
jgi:hypothetical protein